MCGCGLWFVVRIYMYIIDIVDNFFCYPNLIFNSIKVILLI